MSRQGGSPSRSGLSAAGSPTRGSQAGRNASPARSRTGSVSSQPGRGPNPFGPGIGFDPAKPDQSAKEESDLPRVDLPPEAYMQNPLDSRFTKRPGYNTRGIPIKVEVNQFAVSSLRPDIKVYQYDISISPVPKVTRPIVKKLWSHPTVAAALGRPKNYWLCDGNKLAWSSTRLERGEIRLLIDLDEGRKVNKGANKFYFIMKQTTTIEMTALKAYLQEKISWDNTILQCMNFLDHLVRQGPSDKLLGIKRNFYRQSEKRQFLDQIVEVAIGAYASIRMSNSLITGNHGLGLNVDVVNTAMWTGGQHLLQMVKGFLPMLSSDFRNVHSDQAFAQLLAPVSNGRGGFHPSEAFEHLKRFHKLRFTCPHQEAALGLKPGEGKEHTVLRFLGGSEYGQNIANARNVSFNIDGKDVLVVDYFKKRYNIQLKFPMYPLVETTKKGTYIPMELCMVKPMQRFPFKLDADQTAKMIKIAVTRPAERRKKIMERYATLDYQNDEYLKHFGVRISPQFIKTEARLLKNPVLEYNKSKIDPGVSGRWDLRGKKFYAPNTRPLKNWGFMIFEGSVDRNQAMQFAATFKQIYTGHGGRIAKEPKFFDEPRIRNPAESIKTAHDGLMKASKENGPPDLLFVIVRFKNINSYERLKKSGDCRFGMLTQILQGSHVMKNNMQYHSNVAMKVNAKLGGTTNRILGPQPNSPFFKVPTMVLGVDVSHASPGINAPSMASMVMSIDSNAARYAAAVETNGYKVEMVTPANIANFLTRLLPIFKQNVPMRPQHIYYFRDGVSEGQFAQVREYEVAEMKRQLRDRGIDAKFTVIVATKRHHIRMFPEKGDRNGNPLPGTLVEKDVTHPFHWDFYLCSHVAIQGTARPVHYHVILDEANCKPNELQQMIYEQCYMYMRSTTPVSLHPAVYYAHLASSRARNHEEIPSSSGPRTGAKAAEMAVARMAKGDPDPAPWRRTASTPLMPLGMADDSHPSNVQFIRSTMWYI